MNCKSNNNKRLTMDSIIIWKETGERQSDFKVESRNSNRLSENMNLFANSMVGNQSNSSSSAQLQNSASRTYLQRTVSSKLKDKEKSAPKVRRKFRENLSPTGSDLMISKKSSYKTRNFKDSTLQTCNNDPIVNLNILDVEDRWVIICSSSLVTRNLTRV